MPAHIVRTPTAILAVVALCATADLAAAEAKKCKVISRSELVSQYLRRILVVGAHAVLRRARQHPDKYPWLTALLARRPFKVVAVALANKVARTAWALLAKGGTYRAPQLAAAV